MVTHGARQARRRRPAPGPASRRATCASEASPPPVLHRHTARLRASGQRSCTDPVPSAGSGMVQSGGGDREHRTGILLQGPQASPPPTDRLNNRRPPPPRQDPVVTGRRRIARRDPARRPRPRSDLTPIAPIPALRASRRAFACSSCRAAASPTVTAPHARCSGGEEARALPVSHEGAQRASRRRSFRSGCGSSHRRPRLRPGGRRPGRPSRRSPPRPARRSSSSSGRSARAPRTTSTTRRSSPRRPARTAPPSTRSTAPTRRGRG